MASKFQYLAIPDDYSLCNPMIPLPNGPYYYAFGNTPAFDLTEDLDVNGNLDILLLGCGDIRNVLKTTHGYTTGKSHNKTPSLNFHLCDFDLAVLARDTVLLEIIAEIDSSCDSDIQFIWNVWYNLGLTETELQRLHKILDSLCQDSFKPRGIIKIDKERTLSKLKGIWLEWRGISSSLADVKKMKRDFLESKYVDCKSIEMHDFLDLQNSLSTLLKEKLMKEQADFLKDGSTLSDEVLTHTNPTLFRSHLTKYEVHYMANPFDGYSFSEKNHVSKSEPYVSHCKKILALWIARFKSCSVAVTLAWADASQKCLDYSSESTKFDFIDSSNVGDHGSMLGIIAAASLVLKPGGFLFTGTMLWHTFATSLEEYVEMVLGISYHMMPTILGLKLCVDIDLGSSEQISLDGREVQLIWRKVETFQSPTSLLQGDMLSALSVVFQKCFYFANFNSTILDGRKKSFGPTLATAGLIFKHLVDDIKVKFTDIIETLHRYIPLGKDGPFDLAWNCLLAQMPLFNCVSLDIKPSPVVNVTVDMRLPDSYTRISSLGLLWIGVWIMERQLPFDYWVQFSPVGNIRYLKDLPSWIHIISNAYLEVREKNVLKVTFSMTNDDFKKFQPAGIVFVYLGTTGINVTSSCWKELRNAKVGHVDIEQATSVSIVHHKKEDECFLALSELYESIDEYRAKVSFPSTVKGKLGTEFMKRNSVVVLSFSDRKDHKVELRLSCAVEPGACHFKIHRTKGFIECRLLKDKVLNFGAGVLPYKKISFSTLPLFPRDENIGSMIEHMFRGKLSSKRQSFLSRNLTSDDPYFDMKETIQFFGVDYLENNSVNVYMLQTDGNCEMVLYVERFCSCKEHPMIFVRVVDNSKGAKFFEEGTCLKDHSLIALLKANEENRLRTIQCSVKETMLFRRWLRANSFRVVQEQAISSASSWLYHSFITLLFPYVHFRADMAELKNDYHDRLKASVCADRFKEMICLCRVRLEEKC